MRRVNSGNNISVSTSFSLIKPLLVEGGPVILAGSVDAVVLVWDLMFPKRQVYNYGT